jgi:hypothetical protein
MVAILSVIEDLKIRHEGLPVRLNAKEGKTNTARVSLKCSCYLLEKYVSGFALSICSGLPTLRAAGLATDAFWGDGLRLHSALAAEN